MSFDSSSGKREPDGGDDSIQQRPFLGLKGAEKVAVDDGCCPCCLACLTGALRAARVQRH